MLKSFLRIVVLGAGVWLVAVHQAAAQPWYERYQEAEEALEGEDWTAAAAAITAALEQRADSGTRVRTYGMRFIEYLPYLKLGIAYYHLDEPDAALQAFDTEERLGAVADSPAARAELTRYRGLAEAAVGERLAAEGERVAEIVARSLDEARSQEALDDIDGALAALGRALAVDPDNALATSAVERLQLETAARDAARQLDQRVEELLTRGRQLLGEDRSLEAMRYLRQAYMLQPRPDIQLLVESADAAIRAEREARRERNGRGPRVPPPGLNPGRLLPRVVELERDGELDLALEEIERILTIDPDFDAARSAQIRILERQTEEEIENARREAVDALLLETAQAFEADDVEDALAKASRVLALDPGNESAHEYVRLAYSVMNERLLGSSPEMNIPPAIRFADFREEAENGLQAQIVRRPAFQLSGVVIDDSPVEVSFFKGDDEIVATVDSQPLGEYYLTEFTLEDELAAGPSTFRLVATDGSVLTSSSEYVVVYRVPFSRSIWFYSLFGLGVLVLVGAAYGRRVRERQRLRTRRFNPYVAGAPVLNQRMLFGRDQLIERILQTVHNNSLLLHGERRIGKTSLQHHLKRRLEQLDDPDFVFYPVFIDLQGTPEEKFFATLADDVFHDLGEHLDGLQPAADPSNATTYTYRHFVHDMREVIKTLKAKNTKQVKVVLLIDEVDELNDYDPKINQKLRSFFMKTFAENLAAVVSGVQIKKHWEREGSPWYNFFEELEVTPLEPAEAAKLVEEPIGRMFQLEAGVTDRIIELTDSKPYLVQKLCIALVNRIHEAGRRTIMLADVDAIGRPDETDPRAEA